MENTAKMCAIKMPVNVKAIDARCYIANSIPQVRDIDYFISQEGKNGDLTIIDNEEKRLTPIPPNKNIIIQLTPRKKKFELICSNRERIEATIDLTAPIKQSIKNIIPKNPERYTLFYKISNEQDLPRLVCPDLSLTEQGWQNESLYIVRLVTPGDLDENATLDNVKDLYQNCLFAARHKLSLYDERVWGNLAVLKFVADGGDISRSLRTGFLDIIPDVLRGDELVQKEALIAESRYRTATPPIACRQCVSLCAQSQSQCCYIERMKFKVLGGGFLTLRRHAFVCFSYGAITVTKQLSGKLWQRKSTSEIESITEENQFMFIEFKDATKWRLVPRSIPTVRKMLEFFESVRTSESHTPNTVENAPAPLTTGHSRRCSSRTEEDFATIFIQPEPTIKPECNAQNVARVVPGISELILPKEGEKNIPIDMDSQIYRELKVIDPLVCIPPTHIIDFSSYISNPRTPNAAQILYILIAITTLVAIFRAL